MDWRTGLKIRIVAEVLIFFVLFTLALEAFGRALGESLIVDRLINSLEKLISFLWEERWALLWAMVGVMILWVAVRVGLSLIEDWKLWRSQQFRIERI
jgi:hypothetical protein